PDGVAPPPGRCGVRSGGNSEEFRERCGSGRRPSGVRGAGRRRRPDRGVTVPRFPTMIRIDEQNAPAEGPDPEFEGRMGALFEKITKAGVMRETAGLTPTS